MISFFFKPIFLVIFAVFLLFFLVVSILKLLVNWVFDLLTFRFLIKKDKDIEFEKYKDSVDELHDKLIEFGYMLIKGE